MLQIPTHAPATAPPPTLLAWPAGRSVATSPEAAATRGGQRRPSLWIVAAVFIVLVGLQLFYWTGSIASDDLLYLEAARHPPTGPGADHADFRQLGARFLVWGPLRLLTALWPTHWQVLLVIPLLSAASSLVLVGVAVQRWLDRPAALLAMVGLGLVPQFVIAATVTLPDVVATPFVLGGLLLIAGPLISDRTPGRSASPGSFLGGLILAAGYNAKEPAILVLPAVTLFVLWRRRNRHQARRCLLWAWIGAGLWLGVEAAWFAWSVGDPLHHLHAIAAGHRAYESPLPDQPSAAQVLWYLTDYLRWLADPRGPYGPLGPVFLLAVIHGFVAPTELTRLLLCVVVVVGGYLSAGTADLLNYLPIYHQPRYLIPLLPLMAALAARMVQQLWTRGGARRFAVATAAGVLIPVALLAPNAQAGRWYRASDFHAARHIVHQMDGRWSVRDRVIVSPDAYLRLKPLMESANSPRLEPLHSPPRSTREWLERFAGCFVWVLHRDRHPPAGAESVHLGSASCQALTAFARAAMARPPASRLQSALSTLGLSPPSTRPYGQVELYRIE